MFQPLISLLVGHVRAKAVRAAQSAACATVAAVAAAVGGGFLLGALFVWLERRFDTVEVCLMFGGAFVTIAAVATAAMMILRRRPTPPLQLGAALPWSDPALLGAGLQAMRMLTGRKAGSASLIGAFLVGILLSRTMTRK